MDYNFLYNEPSIQLPIRRGNGCFLAFARELENKYSDFLDHVHNYIGSSSDLTLAIAEAKAGVGLIVQSITEYYLGKTSKSLAILQNYMKLCATDLKSFEVDFPSNQTPRAFFLYRMRFSENEVLSRKEMFHIPFESRQIVKTQRYSIPGLPCLYLGGSTYGCWSEMRRPPLDRIFISGLCIRPGTRIKILDLAYSPKDIFTVCTPSTFIQNHIPKPISFLLDYLKLWPLIAFCSIKTMDHTKPFIPEYILPQLLMQWMISAENPAYDAIAYNTTHLKQNYGGGPFYCNYVFPCRISPANGLCTRLSSIFCMSEPVSWQILNSAGSKYSSDCDFHLFYSQNSVNGLRYMFTTEIDQDYPSTEFGLSERAMAYWAYQRYLRPGAINTACNMDKADFFSTPPS